MTVKTGGAWAGTFVTLDATGALSAGTPSGVLYVDGVANGASVTITGSNPYKWSVTLPALTAGQRVDMYITATISTIATASVVASEQADTTILSDGVAVASIANNAITAAAIATDAIDADSIKADAITEIQAGLATPTNITAGTIATVTDVTNAVKISAGTGAGQLDFTSGVVKVNLVQILGTVLTETAGQIAAAFKKFFNVATPTGTVNSLPDAVAGANGGLPTTNGTKLNQTVDLTAGQSIEANGGTVATVTTLTNLPAIPNDWLTAAGIKTDAVAEIADGVLDEAMAGHVSAGTLGKAVADILEDTGTTLPALITPIGTGAGATAKTYTVTNADTGSPIADVDVWASTDLAQTNIVASDKTNSLGQVTFYLDSGTTYYIWRQKDGIDFINPDTEVA